jgi:hypothetical protein
VTRCCRIRAGAPHQKTDKRGRDAEGLHRGRRAETDFPADRRFAVGDPCCAPRKLRSHAARDPLVVEGRAHVV